MMTLSAKVGTVPMMIKVKGNKPLTVGQRIEWREDSHGTKWSGAMVDRLEPIMFITRW